MDWTMERGWIMETGWTLEMGWTMTEGCIIEMGWTIESDSLENWQDHALASSQGLRGDQDGTMGMGRTMRSDSLRNWRDHALASSHGRDGLPYRSRMWLGNTPTRSGYIRGHETRYL